MKKFILFAAVALLASISRADEAEDLLFMEIRSVFSVSKAAESMNEVPMSVYVVEKDELKRWGVRGLYEIFQRVPGYSFYNTDYYGQYGPIGRGMQSVWRYGVGFELMNIVDFGHLVISPSWFKNIEVARGPAGLMWGSGAEAGLINFNLRDDLEGVETRVEVGNTNRLAYDFLYGHREEKNAANEVFFGYHTESQDAQIHKGALTGFGKASDDWKSNGVNPSHSFVGKVKQNDLKVIFFQSHDAHVAPVLWYGNAALQNALEASLGSNFGDQLEVLAYRLEYAVPLSLEKYTLNLYSDYYRKQWQTESVASDTQRKRAVGFNASALVADDRLDINFGGDLWGEDQTTAPSFTSTWANTNYGINWYDANLSPTKYQYRNFFLQGKYAFSDSFKALLGVRTDYLKGDPKQESITTGPRIGFFYTPDKNLSFKYLYNNSPRRPQANEAGSDVIPETLGAHELIMIADLGGRVKLDLTVFSQKLADQITRNNNPALLNSFYNTGGLMTNGLEWALKYAPAKTSLVYWNGSYNQSRVNRGSVNGVEVSEAHNPDDEPLFIPAVTSFVGGETGLFDIMKANLALRSVLNIPYQELTGEYSKKSANFVDFTVSSEKFWGGRAELSFVVLNLLDNQAKLPAYGEHIGNSAGLIPPEGVKYYARASLNF